MVQMRKSSLTRADARVLPVGSDEALDGYRSEQLQQDYVERGADAATGVVTNKDVAFTSSRINVDAAATISCAPKFVWHRARLRRLQWREWVEKAVVLCDAMQIYALVWQLAQPWPWPARWLRLTRWVNAFNLDVLSFRATGAALGATSQPFSLWGEMHGYWVYALAYAMLPSCGWLVLRTADAYWRRSARADHLLATTRLELALLQLFQCLYLPIGLAVLRIVNCDASGIVSVDPHGLGTCWSHRHALAGAAISLGLGGSFLLGLPWLLYLRIHKYLPHTSAVKHERFVQAKELEYALGTSEAFIELHGPLFASFQRGAVSTPVEMCVLKLVLLLVFALLRSPFPSRANEGLQGTLVVALIVVLAIRRRLSRPMFRLASTARLALLADSALVANGVFVLLSSSGVRSALTVATTLTRCLVAVNVTWVVAIGLSLAHSARESMERSTLGNDASVRCWTTTSTWSDPVHVPVLQEYVDTIKHTQATLLSTQLTTPSMRSVETLDAVLQRLQLNYDDAVQRNHLLADQLCELLLLTHELYVDAIATNPFCDPTAFPERALVQLRRSLQQRAAKQTLLSTQTRRVLSKLRVASTWQQPVRRRTEMLHRDYEDGEDDVFGDAHALLALAAQHERSAKSTETTAAVSDQAQRHDAARDAHSL